MLKFGFPYKEGSKKYQVSGVQRLNLLYIFGTPTYGLTGECKTKISSEQTLIKNIDKPKPFLATHNHALEIHDGLKPLLVAHNYALEIQDGLKPSYAQTSFFVVGDVESVCRQNCEVLHHLEDLLELKDFDRLAKQEINSRISWYNGIDEKEGKLDADAILLMLYEGTKGWSGISTDDLKQFEKDDQEDPVEKVTQKR